MWWSSWPVMIRQREDFIRAFVRGGVMESTLSLSTSSQRIKKETPLWCSTLWRGFPAGHYPHLMALTAKRRSLRNKMCLWTAVVPCAKGPSSFFQQFTQTWKRRIGARPLIDHVSNLQLVAEIHLEIVQNVSYKTSGETVYRLLDNSVPKTRPLEFSNAIVPQTGMEMGQPVLQSGIYRIAVATLNV